MEDYWARSGGLLAEWPLFDLGRSVSTHSPNHGRLREGGWESKVEGVGRGLEVVERFALKKFRSVQVKWIVPLCSAPLGELCIVV